MRTEDGKQRQPCPHITKDQLGFPSCAEHGIALGDDLAKCEQRGDGACWYPPVRGKRLPPK